MKSLYKIVKSSQEINFDGTVPIDNTVVVRPVFLSEDPEEQRLAERIEIEVQNRLASIKRELSQKEKIAFEDVNTKKAAIIEKANADAANIVADAHKISDAIREAAREQGYSEGMARGIDDGSVQAQKYIKAAALFLAEIKEKKEALYLTYENEILDLAYDMATRIIRQELKTDQNTIFNIAKQAAKSFRSSDFVKISLAKSDVSETVASDINFIRSLASNNTEVEIELLPDAESGTVIIDDDNEIIDASIPTQLELLREIVNRSKKSIEETAEI